MISPILAAAPALIPAFMAGGSTAAPPVKRGFFGTEVSVGENLLEVATDDGFIMTPVSTVPILLIVSTIALVYAFVIPDFSVRYVAENSSLVSTHGWRFTRATRGLCYFWP